tara:strand:+ start:687 stop:1322 length:636 start_codon:yes stop_codon:yes gene_type:complete
MPLPEFLIDKYKDWKKNTFSNNKNLYKNLADNGQNPKVMIISCCDSRVEANSIFNSIPGDLFIHRNISNLVPEHNTNNSEIISSIEYAITVLQIRQIIILGHSDCGGINYAYNKFSGKIISKKKSHLDNWIQSINPAYEKIKKIKPELNCIKSLEKESIVNSITNLKNYKKVKKLISENKIQIHGLFFEIGSGNLLEYNDSNNVFEIVDYR